MGNERIFCGKFVIQYSKFQLNSFKDSLVDDLLIFINETLSFYSLEYLIKENNVKLKQLHGWELILFIIRYDFDVYSKRLLFS